MALAGNAVKINASTADDGANEIDGITSVDFGPAQDLLETTDFADSTGARTRIQGLKDLDVSLSGQYEASDTGQALLRTVWASGATVYMRFLWDGTNGLKSTFKVESYKINASFDGVVEFSCALKAVSAIVAHP